MLAYPTSLAFRLGAHLSWANVVMSSQSSMASSYANQEILPSNDGATFGGNVNPEAASHQLPMHHSIILLYPTLWASPLFPPLASSSDWSRLYCQPRFATTCCGCARGSTPLGPGSRLARIGLSPGAQGKQYQRSWDVMMLL